MTISQLTLQLISCFSLPSYRMTSQEANIIYCRIISPQEKQQLERQNKEYTLHTQTDYLVWPWWIKLYWNQEIGSYNHWEKRIFTVPVLLCEMWNVDSAAFHNILQHSGTTVMAEFGWKGFRRTLIALEPRTWKRLQVAHW